MPSMPVCLLALALSIGAAAAFSPSPLRTARSATALASSIGGGRKESIDVQGLPGIQAPVNYFDPLGLGKKIQADYGDSGILWLRAAELKHGRVSMLACGGVITVQGLGVHLPGDLGLSQGISYESIAAKPAFDQWAEVPSSGQWQIISTIFLLEWISEVSVDGEEEHYTNGGRFPTWDFLGLTTKMTDDSYKRKLNVELANGRLAMIGIASFWAAHNIAGSVPALPAGF